MPEEKRGTAYYAAMSSAPVEPAGEPSPAGTDQGFFSDLVDHIQTAFARTFADDVSIAAALTDNDSIQGAADRLQASAKAASDTLSVDAREAEGLTFTGDGAAWSDADSWNKLVGQGIGSLAGIIATGGPLKSLLKMGGKKLLSKKLAERAGQLAKKDLDLNSVTDATEEAARKAAILQKYAKTADDIAALAAGGLATGAVVGGSTAEGIRREILDAPLDVLNQSETYSEYFWDIKDADPKLTNTEAHEKAKKELANDLDDNGALTGAAVGFVLGPVVGKYLNKALAGKLAGSRPAGALKLGAAEATTEAAEEGAQAVSQNIQVEKGLETGIDPLRNVAESMVQGALGGGIAGGALGAIATPEPKPDPNAQKPLDPLEAVVQQQYKDATSRLTGGLADAAQAQQVANDTAAKGDEAVNAGLASSVSEEVMLERARMDSILAEISSRAASTAPTGIDDPNSVESLVARARAEIGAGITPTRSEQIAKAKAELQAKIEKAAAKKEKARQKKEIEAEAKAQIEAETAAAPSAEEVQAQADAALTERVANEVARDPDLELTEVYEILRRNSFSELAALDAEVERDAAAKVEAEIAALNRALLNVARGKGKPTLEYNSRIPEMPDAEKQKALPDYSRSVAVNARGEVIGPKAPEDRQAPTGIQEPATDTTPAYLERRQYQQDLAKGLEEVGDLERISVDGRYTNNFLLRGERKTLDEQLGAQPFVYSRKLGGYIVPIGQSDSVQNLIYDKRAIVEAEVTVDESVEPEAPKPQERLPAGRYAMPGPPESGPPGGDSDVAAEKSGFAKDVNEAQNSPRLVPVAPEGKKKTGTFLLKGDKEETRKLLGKGKFLYNEEKGGWIVSRKAANDVQNAIFNSRKAAEAEQKAPEPETVEPEVAVTPEVAAEIEAEVEATKTPAQLRAEIEAEVRAELEASKDAAIAPTPEAEESPTSEFYPSWFRTDTEAETMPPGQYKVGQTLGIVGDDRNRNEQVGEWEVVSVSEDGKAKLRRAGTNRKPNMVLDGNTLHSARGAKDPFLTRTVVSYVDGPLPDAEFVSPSYLAERGKTSDEVAAIAQTPEAGGYEVGQVVSIRGENSSGKELSAQYEVVDPAGGKELGAEGSGVVLIREVGTKGKAPLYWDEKSGVIFKGKSLRQYVRNATAEVAAETEVQSTQQVATATPAAQEVTPDDEVMTELEEFAPESISEDAAEVGANYTINGTNPNTGKAYSVTLPLMADGKDRLVLGTAENTYILSKISNTLTRAYTVNGSRRASVRALDATAKKETPKAEEKAATATLSAEEEIDSTIPDVAPPTIREVTRGKMRGKYLLAATPDQDIPGIPAAQLAKKPYNNYLKGYVLTPNQARTWGNKMNLAEGKAKLSEKTANSPAESIAEINKRRMAEGKVALAERAAEERSKETMAAQKGDLVDSLSMGDLAKVANALGIEIEGAGSGQSAKEYFRAEAKMALSELPNQTVRDAFVNDIVGENRVIPGSKKGAGKAKGKKPEGYYSDATVEEIEEADKDGAVPSIRLSRGKTGPMGKGIPLRTPEARKEAEELAGVIKDRSGKVVALDLVATPPAESKWIKRVEEALGVKVVFVRNNTPDSFDFNGVHYKGGTVYVNEATVKPIRAVIGHEVLHNMRTSEPELYNEIYNAAYERFRNMDTAKSEIEKLAKGETDKDGNQIEISQDLAIEETLADFFGDAMMDDQFAARIFGDNRTLLERAREFLAKWFSKLGINRKADTEFISDVVGLRADTIKKIMDFRKQPSMGIRSAQVRVAFDRTIEVPADTAQEAFVRMGNMLAANGRDMDKLFTRNKTTEKDLGGIFRTIGKPGFTVEAGQGDRTDGEQTTTVVYTKKDGDEARAYVTENESNVWINLEEFESGETDGATAIQGALDYAKANGKRFTVEKNVDVEAKEGGITGVAHFRLIDAMLSSALKHRTTSHISPHAWQMTPALRAEQGDHSSAWMSMPGLKWVPGDDAINIGSLLELSVAHAYTAYTELNALKFNFDTGKFQKKDGTVVTDDAFTEIYNGRMDEGIEGLLGRGDNNRPIKPFGISTLKRAVMLNSMLNEGNGTRSGYDERIGELAASLARGGDANAIFYSRPNRTAAQRDALKAVNMPDDPPTIKDYFHSKIEAMVPSTTDYDWIDHLKEAMFDKLRPIRKLGGKAYMSFRMSTNTAGTVDASLNHWGLGYNYLLKQVTRIKGVKGLIPTLEPVQDDINAFLGWMLYKRVQYLKGKKKNYNELSLTKDQLKALESLGEGKEKLFEETAKNLRAYQTSVLGFMKDTGLLTQADVNSFNEDEYYVPMFRVQDKDGSMTTGAWTQRNYSGQKANIKNITGNSENRFRDVMASIVSNVAHAYDAGLKNVAMREGIEAAKAIEGMVTHLAPEQTGTLDEGVVRLHVNGKELKYQFNDEPDIIRAIKNTRTRIPGGLAQALMIPKQLLTNAVTITPDYVVRNFIRDSLQTLSVSHDGANPLTAFGAARDVMNRTPEVIEMIANNGAFMGSSPSADPEIAAEHARRTMAEHGYSQSFIDSVVFSKSDMMKKWRHLREAAENANRYENYRKARANGRSVREAAYESRDLLDFSMRGGNSIVEFLADTVPFLNSRLQGLYRLGKAGKTALNIKSKWGDVTHLGEHPNKNLMLKTGLGILIVSIALHEANSEDEEYWQLSDEQRDLFWSVKVGDNYIRIPKPFEVGLMFGTVPERIWERFKNESIDNDKLMDRAGFALFQTLSVGLPQAIVPALEARWNYDSFRQRPIENLSDNELPEDRYGAFTSDIAKELGSATGMSPRKIEHLIKGYTGSLGTYVLATMDQMVRAGQGKEGVAGEFSDVAPVEMFAKKFVTPARKQAGQAMGDFYDALNEATQAHASYQKMIAEGRFDDADKIQEKHGTALEFRSRLAAKARKVSKIRKAMNAVRDDETMSAQEKREALNYYDEVLADLTRPMVDAMKEAG